MMHPTHHARVHAGHGGLAKLGVRAGAPDILNQLRRAPGAPRALHAAIFTAAVPWPALRPPRGAAPPARPPPLPPPPQRRIPARHRAVLPLLRQLLRARLAAVSRAR